MNIKTLVSIIGVANQCAYKGDRRQFFLFSIILFGKTVFKRIQKEN